MAYKADFRVIESLKHPHGGRILRLRLQRGEAPSIRELKGATMVARGPSGEETRVKIDGFAVFGGRPTDARVVRTGRVDVVLADSGDDSAQIRRHWSLSGPA